MGLLKKASERRGKLLHKLTKEKKQYIKHVSPQRRKAIKESIKDQRKVLQKIKVKPISKTTKKSQTKELPLSKIATEISSDLAKGKINKVKKKVKKKISGKIKLKKSKILKPKPHSVKSKGLNVSSIRQSIENEMGGQDNSFDGDKQKRKKHSKNFIFTGIPGFDALLEKGIPRGAAVLLAGGAGSGKTIFGLQTLVNQAKAGKKCLYMSFEESEEKLMKHMEDFNWEPRKLIKKKTLMIKRFNPFEITRSVDALLMQAKGELLIDIKPIIFPMKFKPDFIVVDSLTAIASAFTGREDSYRIYIEQLFRFFEGINATSFLITETQQVPTIFSTTGVEEFLADAVVVLYNIKRGSIRERAIEILKLRGAGHKHRIVAANVNRDGIEIFPEQEVFGDIQSN
jgi:KaiC/GvpD/RAD55 family RecA-like ATPase